jgi:SAM-dependent methyltransferase
MFGMLKHPLTRFLELDDPRTTALRRSIIDTKPFLQKIYQDWYGWIASRIPPGRSPVVELGSGAGFMDKVLPGLVTSEVFFCPFVKVVFDGCCLPFADRSLRALVMVDVFHHIPDAGAFLQEASRCLEPGGRILMVEPWVTAWSRWVYARLHHEPFDPGAGSWSFPASGPLSGANSALPWIVFQRDRPLFDERCPGLAIEGITLERPLTYLLSGGVSLRSLMPGFTYGLWRALEELPMLKRLGMFARIEVRKGEMS